MGNAFTINCDKTLLFKCLNIIAPLGNNENSQCVGYDKRQTSQYFMLITHQIRHTGKLDSSLITKNTGLI